MSRPFALCALGVLWSTAGCPAPTAVDDACRADVGDPGASPPIEIDVGCEEDCAGEADGAYDAARGYGWLGDAARGAKPTWTIDSFPIGTHGPENPYVDRDGYRDRVRPYLTWVEGLTGYRIDAAEGVYRVVLRFIEPTFPEPGLRSFDVRSGSTTLIAGLDLAGRTAQDEMVDVAFDLAAQDGRIEVTFAAGTGAPILAGIAVEQQAGRVEAPAAVEVRAGAGEALLRWERPRAAVRGWRVLRRVDGGDAQTIAAEVLAPVFVDRDVRAGQRVSYDVVAVGPDCTESAAATSDEVVVFDTVELGLQVIDVEVDPPEFAALHLDPRADVDAAADVVVGDERAHGTISLRGQSTRRLPKRSFRLELDDGTIDGRTRLELLAETSDITRLTQLASYDLFARMGALAPRARPVLLRINGRVYGVYDDVEHVGDRFLTDRGYGVDDRFRIRDTDLGLAADGSVDLDGFEKVENEQDPSPELEDLVRWLNTAPEHELDDGFAAHFDVDVLARYLAGQLFIANWEIQDGGHYLALDPDTGRFLIVPWDMNNGSWARATMPLTKYTLYEGPELRHWTRAMSAPSVRSVVDALLATITEDVDDVAADVARRATEIAPGLAVEPYVWRRRYDDVVATGSDRLLTFLDERTARMGDLRAELAGAGSVGPILVEIGVADVVVENASEDDLDLADCWLSDDVTDLADRSLADEGVLSTHERRTIPFAAAGTFFHALSCDGGERATSFAFHPVLVVDERYVWSGTVWSVSP
jgi:hypothetical protein